MQKIASRISELTSLAAGSGPQSMAAYGAEVSQLLEQATNVANSRFGADYIFAGTAVDAQPYTATRGAAGAITTVAYVGNDQDATMPIGDGAPLHPHQAQRRPTQNRHLSKQRCHPARRSGHR